MRVVWRVDGGDGGRVGGDRDGGRVGFFAGGRRGAGGAAALLAELVRRIIKRVERSVPWLSHAMEGRSVVVWIRTRGTRSGWGNEGECLVEKRSEGR